MINKMKRQPTEKEEVFTNNVSVTKLVSERDKKLRKLNSKKKLNPILKWRYFSKDNIQMANKYTKVLNTTNIREMQVKNHNETSPFACQNGHYQKGKR